MERLVGRKAPDFTMEALGADGEHFTSVSLTDYAGKWLVLVFYPLDFTFVCPTELSAFSDKREEFSAMGAELLSVSTDSKFSHLAWTRDGLGKLGYPMASDQLHRVSADYGVLQEEEGVALRGLFLIDPEGVVRYAVIHDNDIGRSAGETLRVLAALQTGGLCAAGWTQGQENLSPDLPAQEDKSLRAAKAGEVRIYTQKNCNYCRRTKEFLQEHGVAYQEINLDTDKSGQAFMRQRGYRRLPVVVIGETEISGYEIPKVRQALGLD